MLIFTVTPFVHEMVREQLGQKRQRVVVHIVTMHNKYRTSRMTMERIEIKRWIRADEWDPQLKKGGGIQIHARDEIIIKGGINASLKGYKDKMDNKGKEKDKKLRRLWMGSGDGNARGGGVIELISNKIENHGFTGCMKSVL